jgi:glycosyltransferase involved in cell wall biosynthesis
LIGQEPAADLSVLVPVFNERGTVQRAIERVLEVKLPVSGVEVLVIDDHSTDGTRDWLVEQEFPDSVRVILRDRNGGKGAAVATGLTEARGTYATIMDADLEYDPANIGALLEPLLNGNADVVYGVRGFDAHSAFSFWYVVGNKFVTMAANVLFNTWLSDIMTCQKLMPTALFRALPLRERGFAVEAEITARLVRAGVRVYEVPVTYHARRREEGKKLTALDGLRVLRTLLRCRVDRQRLPDPSRFVPDPGA